MPKSHVNHFGAWFGNNFPNLSKVVPFLKLAATTTLFEIHMKEQTIAWTKTFLETVIMEKVRVQPSSGLTRCQSEFYFTKNYSLVTTPCVAECRGRGGVEE